MFQSQKAVRSQHIHVTFTCSFLHFCFLLAGFDNVFPAVRRFGFKWGSNSAFVCLESPPSRLPSLDYCFLSEVLSHDLGEQVLSGDRNGASYASRVDIYLQLPSPPKVCGPLCRNKVRLLRDKVPKSPKPCSVGGPALVRFSTMY